MEGSTMSKPKNNEFLANLLVTLNEFHQYQLEYDEGGRPPYAYDTLGLAEWLSFSKGVEVEEL